MVWLYVCKVSLISFSYFVVGSELSVQYLNLSELPGTLISTIHITEMSDFRKGGTFPNQLLSELSIQEAHRPQFNTRGCQVHCVLERIQSCINIWMIMPDSLAAQEYIECLTLFLFLFFLETFSHSRYIKKKTPCSSIVWQWTYLYISTTPFYVNATIQNKQALMWKENRSKKMSGELVFSNHCLGLVVRKKLLLWGVLGVGL